MSALIQRENLDALWPDLEVRAQAGRLSDDALVHLLALADDLSAQGDWARAWRALDIAGQAAQQTSDARYLAEEAIHRGILHHRSTGTWETRVGKQPV